MQSADARCHSDYYWRITIRTKPLKIAAFVVLLIVIVLGGALFLVYLGAPKRFNILIVGSDQRGTERARSDVLMIFSIPKSPSQPLSLITIPRDTRVEVPGYGTQKITHAYALGEREDNSILGNIALTKATAKNLLNIPIHATAEFTFESFKEMVDEFGGVETEQGHVDGEAALKIVRDRYREGGDFARSRDQRQIFLELGKKITTLSAAKKLYSFLGTSNQTRLRYQKSSTYIFGLATGLRRGGKFNLQNTYTEALPGHGDSIYTPEFKKNLYYWVADEAALHTLVDKYLR